MTIAKVLRPYRSAIAVALILVLVQAVAELGLPTLMAHMIDEGVIKGNSPAIAWGGLGMLGVALLSALASVAASWFSSRLAAGFGRDLRAQIFRKATSLDAQTFGTLGASSLITRTTNDVTQIQTFVVMSVRMMAMAPIMAIGGLILAFALDSGLALVLAVVVPVLALVMTFLAQKAVRLFRLVQTKIDRLNQVLRESLTGVRVIRAFDRQDFDHGRFEAANLDLADVSLATQRLMAFVMPGMMLVMSLASVALVWFGGLRIQAGDLQVGGLMAFLQYSTQILFSLMMMSMLFVLLPRAAVSAQRINDVLKSPGEGVDGEFEPQGPSNGRPASIEFQDVSFQYPGAEQPALSHVSFLAKPGSFTALIGGTGAGKSTILLLVGRYHDATEGRILVDGTDVRAWKRQALRQRLGFSPQKARLFQGTIEDNLRWGAPEAGPSDLEMALDVSQSNEFVRERPEGVQSRVDQGGANLSGGQRQRLSVGRALVRRPGALLLDDSFSALDARTDRNLRQALGKLTPRPTRLVVAQKVATIQSADHVIVLDEGRVADQGTHVELLGRCAIYQEIVASQNSVEDRP